MPDASLDVGLATTPERIVEFDVDEGTWISLDVSPDGKTIVFDLLGQIFTLPISGGKATLLTSGMAYEQQPRYSPDGRQIAFVSDRSGYENLWVANADGTQARRLSSLRGHGNGALTSPAWAPDGSSIAVSQVGMAAQPENSVYVAERDELWRFAEYDVKSGHMRWIENEVGAQQWLGPAYSADGKLIYGSMNALSQASHYLPPLDVWRLATIDRATNAVFLEMGAAPDRASLRPVLSMDGRFLAYVTGTGGRFGFRLRDLETGKERWLVENALTELTEERAASTDYVPSYAFTPDGSALIAAYGGKIRRIEIATGRATIIPFNAHVRRPMALLSQHQFPTPEGRIRVRSILQPALSPDGNCVAFSALDRIWIMSLPDNGVLKGEPVRLTADEGNGEFFPSWSPDGRWIAYSAWKDGEGGSVRRAYVEPARRKAPDHSTVVSADRAQYFHTAVSADGQRIAAVRKEMAPERVPVLDVYWAQPLEPFRRSLVWLPEAGGVPVRIISLEKLSKYLEYPSDQLYLTADPDRIHIGADSVRWDGSDLRQLATISGADNVIGQYVHGDKPPVLFAPDASRAFVYWHYALFEVSLPIRDRTEQVEIDVEQYRNRSIDGRSIAVHRWGSALGPWVTWSSDGRRVLFSQGGTLYFGEIRPGSWTQFQRIEVPLFFTTDTPNGVIALRGARLITMRGEQIIERGDMVIRDNRIVSVGRRGAVEIPASARVLDVAGKTILPGYIDVHDHGKIMKGIHPQQSHRLLGLLAVGVTATRDPAAGEVNDIFTYRDRERAGDILSPRIFSTGVTQYGTDPIIRTLNDAREAVRPYAEDFDSEHLKIYRHRFSSRRSQALMKIAADEKGLIAAVHVDELQMLLTSAIDGIAGIEHAIGHPRRVYRDVALLHARSGATQTMTFLAMIGGGLHQELFHRYGAPWEWSPVRQFMAPTGWQFVHFDAAQGMRRRQCDVSFDECTVPQLGYPALISREGGRIGVGAHGQGSPMGFHYEMWAYSMGGMSNHDILRAATIHGAAVIGHGHDLGSLEIGKLADLQVLDKNPLEDIKNTMSVRYVMKNGRLYEAENLTEIGHRCKPLDTIYLYDQTIRTSSREEQCLVH